jgi:beta-lactamase class A
MKQPLIGRIIAVVATVALVALTATACATKPGGPPTTSVASPSPTMQDAFAAAITALETKYDARVGVSIFDLGDGRAFGNREDERFGFASSVKVLIAAVVLRTLSQSERAEKLHWTQADIDRAGYAPVTSEHMADGMTIDELAEASVRTSDNVATNLLLSRLGGPSAVSRAFASFGDATTKLTKSEPELNSITPSSPDNTTTPKAFAADLHSLFAGSALTDEQKTTLLYWMSDNATGDTLIRAGAPDSWSVADKSGGAGGIRNDVAVVTPPGRPGILVVILTQRNDPQMKYDDALIARTAEAAFSLLH